MRKGGCFISRVYRSEHISTDCRRTGLQCHNAQSTESSKWHGEPNHEYNVDRVLNQKGTAALEFLVLSFITLFIMFASVDYYTIFAQHQRATQIFNYYMERIRIEGYLSAEDEGKYDLGTGIQGAFKNCGMKIESIQDCPRATLGDARVRRNPGNPDASEIKLNLTIIPAMMPFVSGIFLGNDTSNPNFRIKVGGAVLSERVDP
jgi:hypothetical protein